MKHNYLIIFLLFHFLPLNAQFSYPELIWTKAIQSASDSPDIIGLDIVDVAVSPYGSTFVAGYCTFPCAFGQGVAVIPEAGGQSLFIAKYSAVGDLEWVKDLGTIGNVPVHITAPFEDGVFLATSFTTNSINLGNSIVINRSCIGIGCSDGVVVKFGPSGEHLWSKTITGSSNGSFQMAGIEHNGLGRLMVLVNYIGTEVDFGPGNQFTNLAPNGFCIASMHLNSGNIFEVNFPATYGNGTYTKSMAFGKDGMGVMTGVFFDHFSLPGGDMLNTTDAAGAHFAAAINFNGSIGWVYKLHSNDYMEILACDVDELGSAYLAIDASQDVLLNDASILSISTNYAGAVLKLSGSGFSIPVFIPYNTDDYAIMDVEIDHGGFIYTLGYMSENITIGTDILEVDGCVDGLLTITNKDGFIAGARTVGGFGCEFFANNYYGSCMEVDQIGFLYGAGGFSVNFSEDGFNFNGQGGIVTKFHTSIVSTKEVMYVPLEIFPNPNSGTFSIHLPEIPDAPTQISISDMQGKLVYQQEINQQDVLINSRLPAGLYTIQIKDGSQVYMGKVSLY